MIPLCLVKSRVWDDDLTKANIKFKEKKYNEDDLSESRLDNTNNQK